jgi:phosphohistidine phosphatase
MRVLLVRHGEAVDRRVTSSDVDRWLTEAGRRTVVAVGRTLGELGLDCTRFFTSPLLRAVQTAELLAASLPSHDARVEAHRALASDEGTTAQAVALLDDVADDEVVAMVTHVPKVGILAAELGELSQTPAFPTAAVCLVEVTKARGRAVWMLDPDTLAVRRF